MSVLWVLILSFMILLCVEGEKRKEKKSFKKHCADKDLHEDSLGHICGSSSSLMVSREWEEYSMPLVQGTLPASSDFPVFSRDHRSIFVLNSPHRIFFNQFVTSLLEFCL